MKKSLLAGIVFAALIACAGAAEKSEPAKSAEVVNSEKAPKAVKKKTAKKVAKKAKSAEDVPTKEITYLCSYDNSQQPALILVAKSKEPRPLFVTLHTWSSTYKQCRSSYAGNLVKHDVYMIAPNFRGNNLSGGQKQRLLIARALAGDPEIFVLDDASSALDYRTDADLRRALREQYRNTTTVVIAQRVSSLRHADLILVLDDSNVIGAGNHESLMTSCEEYRIIAQTQMGDGKEAL